MKGMLINFLKVHLKSHLKTIIVSQEDHSKNDAFLVAVMTHGDSNGQLHALDKPYDIRDLWVNFVGTECLTLVGKPKLFFIQVDWVL